MSSPRPDGTAFLSLPPELLERILARLPLLSIIACECTCRLLRTLSSGSLVLQYTKETQAAGVVDAGSASRLVLADRLARLRARERAWRTLNVHARTTIPVTHEPSGIYDLTGGVYVLGETDNRFMHVRPTRAVRYVRLPSTYSNAGGPSEPEAETSGQAGRAGRGRLPGEWPLIDVGEGVIDIGLSVLEHDLIAVVTSINKPSPLSPHPTRIIALHLRQLSTGLSHPSARAPVLYVTDAPLALGRCSVGLEIVGARLALLLTFPFAQAPARDALIIFDWRTGTRLAARDAPADTYSAFVFLAPDVLLLPNKDENTLELCRLPPLVDGPPPPPATSTTSPSSPTPPVPPPPYYNARTSTGPYDFVYELQVARTLALPRLARGCKISRLSCRSEPNPVAHGTTPNTGGAPFADAAEDAIVLFNLVVQDLVPLQFGPTESFSFVVHRRALLDLLELDDADGEDEETDEDEDEEENGAHEGPIADRLPPLEAIPVVAPPDPVNIPLPPSRPPSRSPSPDNGPIAGPSTTRRPPLPKAKFRFASPRMLMGFDDDDDDSDLDSDSMPSMPALGIVHSSAPSASGSSRAASPSSMPSLDTVSDSSLSSASNDSDSAPPVPWAVWGPRTTRWLPHAHAPMRWITTTAGQRHVVLAGRPPPPPPMNLGLAGMDGGSPRAVRVLDFNPVRARQVAVQVARVVNQERETRAREARRRGTTLKERLKLRERQTKARGAGMRDGEWELDRKDRPVRRAPAREAEVDAEDEGPGPSAGGAARVRYVASKEPAETRGYFDEMIVSELPYVEVTSAERFNFTRRAEME